VSGPDRSDFFFPVLSRDSADGEEIQTIVTNFFPPAAPPHPFCSEY